MCVDDPMTEDRLAEQICDDFEINAVKWKSNEFHELLAVVVYYEAALRVARAKPFRQEFVQSKVLTFLDMKLLEASERLVFGPLESIRKRIQRLENDV